MKPIDKGQKYLDINGIRLNVQQFFNPKSRDLPVIVFLHHALGSVAQWKGFPFALGKSASCDVLVYDRQGHGMSSALKVPRAAHYMHNEAWEILPEVLDACGISDPIFYGHSDGGTIALLYASKYKTKGVISEAAHTFVEDITLQGIRDAITRKQYLLDGLERYHNDKTEALFEAWENTWLKPAFLSWDITSELADIDCPVMVIQGENDNYGSAEQVTNILSSIDSVCESLLVPDCGHAPHMEKQTLILEKVTSFINNHLINQ